MPAQPRYILLPSADEGSEHRPHKPDQSARIKLASVIGLILGLVVATSLILRQAVPSAAKGGQFISQCGSSRKEAALQGCKFDIMSFSWMPPACYDHKLTTEFSRIRDWEWFLDENRTQSIARGEVDQGKFDVLYVSTEYHVLHCTYMWRKMHRAILKQAPMDGYIGEYNHTEHCEDVLVGERDKDLGDVALMVIKYPSCGV